MEVWFSFLSWWELIQETNHFNSIGKFWKNLYEYHRTNQESSCVDRENWSLYSNDSGMEGDEIAHHVVEVSFTPDLRLNLPDSLTNQFVGFVAENVGNLVCDVVAYSNRVVVT